MRFRIRGYAALLAAALTLGGVALVSAATPAQAYIPEVCTTANSVGVVCINANSGGPWVVGAYADLGAYDEFDIQFVYGRCNSSDLTTTNCPYSGVPAGHIIFQMPYYGGGAWNGKCVGDAYNNPGYADTSLNTCNNPGTGQGGGWGTLFWGDSSICSGGSAYYSFHWPWGEMVTSTYYGQEWYENGSSSNGFCLEKFAQSQGGAPAGSPSAATAARLLPAGVRI